MIHNRSLWPFIPEETRKDLIETVVSLKKELNSILAPSPQRLQTMVLL